MAKDFNSEQDTRSVLFDTIEELNGEDTEFQTDEFREMLEALKNLNEYQTELYKRDRQGVYPEYDAEKNKKMLGLYEKAIKAVDAYLEDVTDDEKQNGVAKAAETINKIMLRDINHLKEFPEDDISDFPKELNSARTFTVNITNAELETWGGAQSKRMPMTVKDRNGKTVSGVFTPKRTVSLQKSYDDMIDVIGKNFPECAEIFNGLYENFKNECNNGTAFSFMKNGKKENPRLYGDEKDLLLMLGTCMKKYSFDYNATVDVISKVTGKTKNELEDIKGFSKATKVFDNLADKFYMGEAISMLDLKLKEGTRIDNRNAAMSTVANLLGRKDLICPAYPMTVVNGNEQIEGTFMEMAKGVDPAHVIYEATHYSPAHDTIPTALIATADLQVIDYICGNVDRHGNNFFYRFERNDNGLHLVGLTGIDNDASFGENETPFKDNKNRLVGAKNMKAVSASMANKLKGLSEDMLRLSLRAHDLSEKSIDSACKRLSYLKQCIEKSKTEFEKPENKLEIADNPGFTINGLIRVIPDKDFAKIRISQLSNDVHGRRGKRTEKENMFDRVETYNVTYRGNEEALKADPDYVNNNSRFSRDAMAEKRNSANELVAELKSATGIRGTSPEFEEMRTALIAVRDFCKANSKQSPDFSTVLNMNKELIKLRDSCVTYLKHKQQDNNPSSYAKNRMKLAKKVFDFANNSTIDLDSISESEKQDLRNNEERNIQELNKKAVADIQKLSI